MPKAVSRPALVIVLTLLGSAAVAATPGGATAAETVSAERQFQIRTWLALLADPEPRTRGDAREGLLGLAATELPLLRQAIVSSSPLRPAQVEPLEDIVSYIVTRATLGELPHDREAFLGVSLPSEFDDEFRQLGSGPTTAATEAQVTGGVSIVSRLGGFVAYRFLEDGDFIQAITLGGTRYETPTVEAFRSVIRNAPAGRPVTFEIRRAARLMEITFPLDAKATLHARDLQTAIDQAQSAASDYWQQSFASLVGEDAL